MTQNDPILLANRQLWKADRDSQATGRDVWEFAVAYRDLRAAGVTEAALRSLL
jgi:hypothetical protein